MIATSKLSSKYQTTIPKSIIKRLGMKPSNTIIYQEEGPYVIIRPQRTITAKEALALFPRKKTTRAVSLEEMQEAIEKERLVVAIDTNILVRYITQDDLTQAKKVALLLAKKEIFFISIPVILETVWVLEEAYRWKKEEVILTLETLLEIGNFIFEDKASISQATWAYRKGGDWSDHLIKAQCQKHHCTSLMTFDQKFAQFYPDFVKLLK